MKSVELSSMSGVDELVAAAQKETDPVVVRDEGHECMVAMSPGVFKRLMFEREQLNSVDRSSLHL